MNNYTYNTRQDVDDYEVYADYRYYLGHGHDVAIEAASQAHALAVEEVANIVREFDSDAID